MRKTLVISTIISLASTFVIDFFGNEITSTTPLASMPLFATETTSSTTAVNTCTCPCNNATITETSTSTVTETISPNMPYGNTTETTTMSANATETTTMSANATSTTETTTYTPTQTADVYIQYKGKNSGKCLDVKGHSNDTGASLVIWKCDDKDVIKFMYNPYTQEIKAKGSYKCVDVRNGNFENGTPIQVFDCNFSSSQRWVLDNGLLKNMGSNKCMNVAQDSHEDGADVILYMCDIYSGNGIWSVV